jgi:hypothetical protein
LNWIYHDEYPQNGETNNYQKNHDLTGSCMENSTDFLVKPSAIGIQRMNHDGNGYSGVSGNIMINMDYCNY